MTDKETIKLALEALQLNNSEWKSLADSGDCGFWRAEDQDHYKQTNEAITACEQALAAQPARTLEELYALSREVSAEQPAPVQDSTCNETLRAQGKAYPRTCKKCKFGPCIGLANAALDKKAEHARELGLDYEPAPVQPVAHIVGEVDHAGKVWKPAPVQPSAWESEMRSELAKLGFEGQCPESIGITIKGWFDAYAKSLTAQPAPVQPVAGKNQSPYPEYDRGFSAGWDRGFAAAQPAVQEPVAVKHMMGWVESLKRQSDYGQHMRIPGLNAGACFELAIELEQFINTTPPAQPAVPDAIGPNEDELPAYAAGWNDCRAEMLRGMKP